MGMKREAYEEALKPLTLELVSMARWVKATDARVVVLFEGRDTAGKGGAIGAVREALAELLGLDEARLEALAAKGTIQ